MASRTTTGDPPHLSRNRGKQELVEDRTHLSPSDNAPRPPMMTYNLKRWFELCGVKTPDPVSSALPHQAKERKRSGRPAPPEALEAVRQLGWGVLPGGRRATQDVPADGRDAACHSRDGKGRYRHDSTRPSFASVAGRKSTGDRSDPPWESPRSFIGLESGVSLEYEPAPSSSADLTPDGEEEQNDGDSQDRRFVEDAHRD